MPKIRFARRSPRRARLQLGSHTWLLAAAWVVVLGAGIALRMWIAAHRTLSSDEVVVALMAERILGGHLRAFYPGQYYGGIGAYPLAALFAIVGPSPWAVAAAPVGLNLVASLLLWRLAKAMGMGGAGLLGAGLFWVFPYNYVWMGQFQGGFRWVVLDAGLASMLFATKILASPKRWGMWFLLGLAAGVGLWGSLEIAYFVLPILAVLISRIIVMAARKWRQAVALAPRVLTAALGMVIGASPWLFDTLVANDKTLSAPVGKYGYLEHLNVFFTRMLPIIFGVGSFPPGFWFLGTTVGITLFVILSVLVVLAMVLWLTSWNTAMLTAAAAAYPFLYAMPPTSWYWQDGRYGIYLVPISCLAISYGLLRLGKAVAWIGIKMGAGVGIRQVVAVTVAGALLVGGTASSTFTLERIFGSLAKDHLFPPASATLDTKHYYATLASQLEARHINRLYANYWLAYPLDFYSHGKVLATPVGLVRYPSIYCRVATAPKAAWLFGIPPLLLWPNSSQPTAAGLNAAYYRPAGLRSQQLMALLHSKGIHFHLVVLSSHFEIIETTPNASSVAQKLSPKPIDCASPSRRSTSNSGG